MTVLNGLRERYSAVFELHDPEMWAQDSAQAGAARRGPDWDAALAEAPEADRGSLEMLRDVWAQAGGALRLRWGREGVEVHASPAWIARHGKAYAAAVTIIYDLAPEAVRRHLGPRLEG